MNKMSTFFSDIKYSVRRLLNNPGFTTVAVFTLAIGIGANTAIFSTIDAVLLQPLPYADSHQLVKMDETMPDGRHNGSVSGGAFLDWQAHTQLLEHVAYFKYAEFTLTGIDQSERVRGHAVTADFLRVLRVEPIMGRGFAPNEDQLGSDNHVVVLNHAYWQSHFGSDPEVVGRVISLDLKPYTIIGVLPPDRIMENDVSLLVPVVIDPRAPLWQRREHMGRAIGRLKPGVSVAQAEAELRSIREQEQVKSLYPAYKSDWSVALTSLEEKYFPSRACPTLVTLMSTTAIVLLIACANVANLLLARGNARQREMAIRAALGAGPWQIIRQVLIESLVLALLGGALGVVIAWSGMDLPARTITGLFPEMRHPVLNLRMLLFSMGLACGCGLLFGTLPALKACKIDVNARLKEGGRSGMSVSRVRSQSLLVVSEVTLTLLLLIGAGLFLRSFLHVLEVDPGFNPDNTLAFDLRFAETQYPQREDRYRFINDLTERINALSGVESAASAYGLPLSYMGWTNGTRRADRPSDGFVIMGTDFVTKQYFSAIGIPLLRGRTLTEADNREGARRVAVIDSGVVRQFYPNEDSIGQAIETLGQQWEIVGVVAPVRWRNLETDPQPRIYLAQVHNPDRSSIIVRTTADPLSLIPAIRQTIGAANPDLPIFNIRTMEQAIQSSVAKKRTTLILLGCLTVVAVGLACMGLYGFMSYFVGQRTRELCIRSALGAQRLDIIKQVVGVGMKLSVIGITIGLVGALALARLVQSQLFEIKTHDPLVYLVSICLIGLVAFLSVYLPARRVARIDPMKALRYE
jgi:predicted permease